MSRPMGRHRPYGLTWREVNSRPRFLNFLQAARWDTRSYWALPSGAVPESPEEKEDFPRRSALPLPYELVLQKGLSGYCHLHRDEVYHILCKRQTDITEVPYLARTYMGMALERKPELAVWSNSICLFLQAARSLHFTPETLAVRPLALHAIC